MLAQRSGQKKSLAKNRNGSETQLKPIEKDYEMISFGDAGNQSMRASPTQVRKTVGKRAGVGL